ncbi:unnamed protein product, partial [Prorocentrum cordatum]
AAVKEPDSEEQQGIDGAVAAPEHMKAWRCMPGQKHKEYTKEIWKPKGATPESSTLARWPDGFRIPMSSLTYAEFDAIETAEKIAAKGASVWETRPTASSRIWVSRPTRKNNVFCIHSKVDDAQSQMCQVKATAFEDEEEQVKEAEKLAVKPAQKLASTQGLTKEALMELRDKALPTPTKAEAAQPKQSKAVMPTEPATPTPDEKQILSQTKRAAISRVCEFCGAEPMRMDMFKKYNLCQACYDDSA